MASLETRVTKLEQSTMGRQLLAVLICEDGQEDQAAADYLASIPVDKHPLHLVVVRRFCTPQEPVALHEGAADPGRAAP